MGDRGSLQAAQYLDSKRSLEETFVKELLSENNTKIKYYIFCSTMNDLESTSIYYTLLDSLIALTHSYSDSSIKTKYSNIN